MLINKFTLMKVKTKGFNTIADMDSYMTSSDYPNQQQVCLGIFFESTTINLWDYSLRYNIT